jgi:ribosome-binding protein aMBF1 (putative translation factor)
MPFKAINVSSIIEDEKRADKHFAKAWDESRTEYKLMSEIVRLRKEKGLSQAELARKTGCKQQVISRIEKKENSPTLKTLCEILDVLDYDIQLVKKD